MVTATAYPSCCGATVLHGFNGPEDRVISEFLGCVIGSNNGHKLTFVLNQGQVDRYPNLLAEAARVGFVLGAAWINNLHDSYCYEFQRAGRRIRLSEALRLTNFPIALMPDMGGSNLRDENALIPDQRAANNRHIVLGGNVPAWVAVGDYIRTTALPTGVDVNEVPIGSIGRIVVVNANGVQARFISGPQGYNRGHEVQYLIERRQCERVEGGPGIGLPIGVGVLQVGGRFTVNSPRSRYHNEEHTVLRIVAGGYGRNIIVFRDANDEEGRLTEGSCIPIPGEAPADPWRVLPFRGANAEPAFVPPVTTIYRHGMDDMPPPPPIVQRVEVPAPVPDPVIIHRSFHARYRDDRIGAGYGNLVELREANPRITRYQERLYWSDGRDVGILEHIL